MQRRYRGADKSLARPGRKQVNFSLRIAWISFGALPCRGEKNLMSARVSMLLKSRASLTCFRACFLPGRAKNLSAPRQKERSWPISKCYSSILHVATRNPTNQPALPDFRARTDTKTARNHSKLSVLYWRTNGGKQCPQNFMKAITVLQSIWELTRVLQKVSALFFNSIY